LAIREHLRQILRFSYLHGFSGPLGQKLGFLGGGAISTLNELVLTFRGLYLCVQFGENRRRNATVRVSTDRQTDRQTDANRIYYLSHAICYSYGADNNEPQQSCCP